LSGAIFWACYKVEGIYHKIFLLAAEQDREKTFIYQKSNEYEV
jgi:hypothetical protein